MLFHELFIKLEIDDGDPCLDIVGCGANDKYGRLVYSVDILNRCFRKKAYFTGFGHVNLSLNKSRSKQKHYRM
jgi:hypothetical protein